jgi:nicotinate-nucleotide adenylyltransferase
MRLGLLGGSFDPIHYGHLLLAECAREQLALDEVWLIPAAVPPHKREQPPTPIQQRLEMAELAAVGNPALVVSRLEADREGISYTVETLQELARQRPEAQRFFLVGADMLSDLPNWRQPERICDLATIVAVGRPGNGPPRLDSLADVASAQRIEQFRRQQVEMPAIGLSSTEIRRRVAAGQSIRYMTPPAVVEYIAAKGLYRLSDAPDG